MSELREKIRKMVRDEFIYRLLYEADDKKPQKAYEVAMQHFSDEQKEDFLLSLLEEIKVTQGEKDFLGVVKELLGPGEAEAVVAEMDKGKLSASTANKLIETLSRNDGFFKENFPGTDEDSFVDQIKIYARSKGIKVEEIVQGDVDSSVSKSPSGEEYHLRGEDGMTLEQIADKYGITKEAVRQIFQNSYVKTAMSVLNDKARRKMPILPDDHAFLDAFYFGLTEKESFQEHMKRKYKLNDAQIAYEYGELKKFMRILHEKEEEVKDYSVAFLAKLDQSGVKNYLLRGGEENFDAMLEEAINSFVDYLSEGSEEFEEEYSDTYRNEDKRTLKNLVLTAIEHSGVLDEETMAGSLRAYVKFERIIKEELNNQTINIVGLALRTDQEHFQALKAMEFLSSPGRPSKEAAAIKQARTAKRVALYPHLADKIAAAAASKTEKAAKKK